MKKSYIIAFWTPIQSLHPHFCLDYFIPFFQKYGDIQCLDFQAHTDARTMHLLQQADLVVIGLPAISVYFDSFFRKQRIPFSHVCYAILDYFLFWDTETRQLCHRYRIPDHLILHIPYNIQFQEAICRGQVQRYLDPGQKLLETADKRFFLDELFCAAMRILCILNE